VREEAFQQGKLQAGQQLGLLRVRSGDVAETQGAISHNPRQALSSKVNENRICVP